MGSPIELIIPAASSHSRGGGLPARGSSVTVLVTKAANGKRSSSASPNARRGGDHVERPGGVDDRVRRAGCRTARQRGPGTALQRRRVEHRPVDAQAHVARRGSAPTQPKQRAEAARHARLERELRGHAAARAQRAHGLEHRRRAAGEDLDVRRRAELGGEQVGDEAVVAGRAVVGGDAARRASSSAPGGVRGVAEAEQRERAVAELVLQDRRAARSRRRRRRGSRAGRRAAAREAAPERAEQPQPVARAQLGEPRGAGPDVLEHELERPAGACARATEKARGRNGRSSSPPPQRSAAASM